QKICTLQAEEAQIDLDTDAQTLAIRAKNAWIDIPGQARGRFLERTEYIRWDSVKERAGPRDMPVAQIQKELDRIESQVERRNQLRAMEACFFITNADFSNLVKKCAKKTTDGNQEKSRYN